MSAPSLEADFREALSRWASGVTVVTTTRPDGSFVGFTASSFSSLSLAPPLVLVCLDRRAESFDVFSSASHYAVSVLAAAQAETALKLATKGADKFDGAAFALGAASGAPLFDGALVHLECAMREVLPGGDHVILIGEVLRASSFEGEPLLYYRRRFGGFSAG